MIDNNYNQKFRDFFSKFYKQFSLLEKEDEKTFLWDLAVDFVERNRDFVMQYPLINYWSDIDKDNHDNLNKQLISSYNKKNINLYFHIPFCKTRCTYCNFHIIVWDGSKNIMQKIYIEKLKYEIKEFLTYNNDFIIDSIFIWWWTPSYLDDDILDDFLKFIIDNLWQYMSNKIEFSFELNPDSITLSKIKILKKNKVNRVSIWVQTFDNDIIRKINRTYDENTVLEVLKNLKSEWFDDINIDMIYWLPWSNYENMRRDLDIVKKLDITHVTYYPLYYYDEATLVKTWKREDNIKQIYDFYDEVIKELWDYWFNQYGREYFCKDNLIHNYQNNYVSNKLLYWFGHSAYSFNWDVAFYKEQNLKKYIENKQNLQKIFYYNDIDFDRRLFVLWSRNIKIYKVNIKNFDIFYKNVNILLKLWLIQEYDDFFKLTAKWLKYQEVVAHMFV